MSIDRPTDRELELLWNGACEAMADEDPQDAFLPDVDDLVERGYMQDFGAGYPEWC